MIFLKVLAAWTLFSIILAPIIGGFLRHNRRSSYPKYPPLPSGSIDRDEVHG
jgi:hypothetical protein